MIQAFHVRGRKTTVKKIQKLASSLNFICQALPAGHPFLCSLYQLTRGSSGHKAKLGNHRKITIETFHDLVMFQSFLDQTAHISRYSIPFIDKLELVSLEAEFYDDATGAADKGLGCCYGHHWFQAQWSETNLFQGGFTPNIALLEQLAIVVAFHIWGHNFTGKTLVLRSDNTATCNMINKKKANVPAAMDLIRKLTLTCFQFQIVVKAHHIAGKSNTHTDQLS